MSTELINNNAHVSTETIIKGVISRYHVDITICTDCFVENNALQAWRIICVYFYTTQQNRLFATLNLTVTFYLFHHDYFQQTL
jgi:hypothetical protein